MIPALTSNSLASDVRLKNLSAQAGQNFADVAGFINEVDLSSKGLPPQSTRVERIRQLALRMYRA
jgi:hypothetical protein